MKLRFAFPPKSMWMPVTIIVVVLAIGYALAQQTDTGYKAVSWVKSKIGLV